MTEQRIREIVREELVKEAAVKAAASIQAQEEFNKSLESRVLKRGVSAYASGE